MLEIFRRIQKIFNNDLEFKSEEFIQGFRECFTLFEIGFKKIPQYNTVMELNNTVMELNKVQAELENISEQLVSERKRNDKLIEAFDINGNVNNVNTKLLKLKTRITVHKLLFSTETDNEEKIKQLKSIMKDWEK